MSCQAGEAVGCVEGFVGDGYYQNRDDPEHGVSSFGLLIDSEACDENVSSVRADFGGCQTRLIGH